MQKGSVFAGQCARVAARSSMPPRTREIRYGSHCKPPLCFGRMMKLHNYFRSSASYRVRIALGLKGLAYEYLPVHLVRGEHLQAPFTSISTDMLVPVLEVESEDASSGGWEQLSQSMAIIEYLDETHPEPPLLPSDATGRAHVRALAQMIACDVHPVNNLRVPRYLVRELKLDDAAKTVWYRHWVREGLQAFERQLARRPPTRYCYGDSPTMADCCLVPQIFNAQRFDCDLSGLPRTMTAYETAMQLEAVQAAHPALCPDAEG